MAGIINVAFVVPTIKDTNLRVQTVATGLSAPISMAFIGPNDILVIEKNSGLFKRIKDGRVLSRPLLDVNVATASERASLQCYRSAYVLQTIECIRCYDK